MGADEFVEKNKPTLLLCFYIEEVVHDNGK
jgi:hypothetical protein